MFGLGDSDMGVEGKVEIWGFSGSEIGFRGCRGQGPSMPTETPKALPAFLPSFLPSFLP